MINPMEKNKAGVDLIFWDFIQCARKLKLSSLENKQHLYECHYLKSLLFSGLYYWSATLSMREVIWEPGNDCLLYMAACLRKPRNILKAASLLRADAWLKQK